VRDAPAGKPTVRVTQYSSLNRPTGRTGLWGRIPWYVPLALRALIRRSGQIIAGVVASLALVACGSSGNQASHEPKRSFKVEVASATFPASQRLAQKTHLVITVRNTGTKAIPNLAVTICNVSCAYNAPKGQGTSAQAFAQVLNQPYLANPSRPIWIVDRPPGPCLYSCRNGGAGAYVTAYSNTWALGHQLAPGHTATFDWGVTAVSAGSHVVAWQVAAGLAGNAKAVLADGSQPGGTFAVHILTAPQQSYVNSAGKVVVKKG
jgi:hypothetical protein